MTKLSLCVTAKIALLCVYEFCVSVEQYVNILSVRHIAGGWLVLQVIVNNVSLLSARPYFFR